MKTVPAPWQASSPMLSGRDRTVVVVIRISADCPPSNNDPPKRLYTCVSSVKPEERFYRLFAPDPNHFYKQGHLLLSSASKRHFNSVCPPFLVALQVPVPCSLSTTAVVDAHTRPTGVFDLLILFEHRHVRNGRHPRRGGHHGA